MGGAESLGHARLCVRAEDQKDMVGHQAIGPHCHARLTRLLSQKVAIQILIAILKKDGFASISSRGDVVRNAWSNYASKAGICHH